MEVIFIKPVVQARLKAKQREVGRLPLEIKGYKALERLPSYSKAEKLVIENISNIY